MLEEADAPVALDSILCTEELTRRPSRPPELEKENRALIALIQAMVDSPKDVLQELADTICEMLGCGSAGISLLTNDGGTRFYWPAISGVWKPHIGGGTPRNLTRSLLAEPGLLTNGPRLRGSYLKRVCEARANLAPGLISLFEAVWTLVKF